jgi:hypothetical protein
MVWVMVKPREGTVGAHGAVTRDNAYFANAKTTEDSAARYPSRAELGHRPSLAAMQQPRKPSSGVGRAGGGARRSMVSESPRSFSVVGDVDEEADSSNASIYSGAAGRQSPLPLSAMMAARTAGAASQSPPMQGLLNYSHLLRSSTTSPPMTRHGTTAASPLAPVLVHGIDVQACLSHVGLHKKHHYEDTIAKMQIAALAMIPADFKADLEKKFPAVLKTCVGVLGALAAVSRMRASATAICPMPTLSSRNMAGLRDEATSARKTILEAQRSFAYRSDDALNNSDSRPRSVTGFTPEAMEWTPQLIAAQLLRKQSGGPGSSSDPQRIAAQTSFVFQTFERAAEEFLASGAIPHVTEANADAPLSEPSEHNEKLQAMRQALLTHRMEHLKTREKRARSAVYSELAAALASLLDDFVWATRHALGVHEQREFELAIKAAATAEALQLVLRARTTRRTAAAESVARVIAEQDVALREDTDRRVAAIHRDGSDAVRTVQRAFHHTDQQVKSAIKQEREARLRELLTYRRANPTIFFPDYVDVEQETEFIPMRIATDGERERQMLVIKDAYAPVTTTSTALVAAAAGV